MPSIHNISSKQILKFLKKQGFLISHRKGSHVQLRHEDFFVTVPDHGQKILKVKTVLSILKQSGITKVYFLDNL